MGGFFAHPIGFVILDSTRLYYRQRMRRSRDKTSTFSTFHFHMIYTKRIFEFVSTYFPGERFRDLEAKQISVIMEKEGPCINEVIKLACLKI